MSAIQMATESDIAELWALDPQAAPDTPRREFLKRAVKARTCYLVLKDRVLGFAVFDYHFYSYGFVHLLFVHPNYRLQGLGQGLMQYLETICTTPKIFTSTNLSNQSMQALLAKMQYQLSGVLHHLDEHDPELVYVKMLN
jgi:GNAT superfamily N-acetyltransferase